MEDKICLDNPASSGDMFESENILDTNGRQIDAPDTRNLKIKREHIPEHP